MNCETLAAVALPMVGLICLKEVLHGGNFLPPRCGGCQRTLRLTLVGSPDVLTNVVQAFSVLQIRLRILKYIQTDEIENQAVIELRFTADDRTVDLVRRKLGRLMGVLSFDG